MIVIFDILRRQTAQSTPYRQQIRFETEDPNETVATALLKINRSGDYSDEQGNTVLPIAWEAGCLQKKCGACAMLINHSPGLACDAFLKNYIKKGKKAHPSVITLAPLGKFPVVKDLVCDRSVLFENLKTLQVWAGESAQIREKDIDRAYDASLCLQCGCCLEACPNFYPDGAFTGAAGFAPLARLVSAYSKEEKNRLRRIYQQHVYNGCGKSLACVRACPAGIDLDRLLSRSNAVSVWRRD